eukprot:2509658-Rhodomonas_salina.1
MGTESPVLHRAITKKSVPFPQFFFTPPMQTKYIDEKVEIRVETGFSVSGPALASSLLVKKSRLVIAANSLVPGKYVVRVAVWYASKQTTMTEDDYTFTIKERDFTANVMGGNMRMVSSSA